MVIDESPINPQSFESFGELLRFLRRRARLTQRDLGASVGYSEGHINRFEKNKHLPDPVTVAALFVPELDIKDHPELAARLIELAGSPHPAPARGARRVLAADAEIPLETIPPALPGEITRTTALARLRWRLSTYHRLILCGMPGMGKTTLAGDVARELCASMPVFWLTLTPGINTSADAILPRLAMFLCANGHDKARPLLAAGARASYSLDRQIALIGSVLAAHPALLCFDNAELIEDSQDCLHLLQHLGATTGAWILLIARESLPQLNFTEFTLDGFEDAEGVQYLAHAVDSSLVSGGLPMLDEEQTLRLVAKTGGSPMLLRLAAGRLEGERIGTERVIGQLEAQPEVSSYLLQTVQKQLSLFGWRLLMLLAIFQQPVDLYDAYLNELAESLGGISSMNDAILELMRRRLIDQPTTAHLNPLVRDYVHLTLVAEPAVRQRLNRLAAEWLRDARRDAFAAAWHYHRAGLADSAVEMLEDDKNGIIERGQAGQAVAVLEEIQDQLKRRRTGQTDLLRRLLALRGSLLAGTLRSAEGEQSLRQALELAAAPAVRASITCQLADLLNQRSDYIEALRLVQEVQAGLPPGDLLLRARLAVLECGAQGSLGSIPEALNAAQLVLELAGQLKGLPASLTGELRARAEIQLANIERTQRHLDESMEHARRGLAAARLGRQPRLANLSLAFIGGLYYDQGDLEASFRCRTEALAGLLEIGDVHSAAYSQTYLADIHHLRLETGLALEKLDRAAETLGIVEDLRGLAAVESLRAGCLLWQGRASEARGVIEQVIKAMHSKATERLWGYRMNRRAAVHLVQGETQAALAVLQQAQVLPAAKANLMLQFELHSTLAVAHLAAGDIDSARLELAASPYQDGLSRWAQFDRDLVEGYIALAGGERPAALQAAGWVRERTAAYPLYQRSALQLESAAASGVAPRIYPQYLWVEREI